MTTLIRRRPAVLVAALAALGIALSACGTGPSQVGAAVIVGDHAVSVETVSQRVDALMKNPDALKSLKEQGDGVPVASRYFTTDQVQHELLRVAQQREGLVVNEADADGLIEGQGGLQEMAKAFFTDEAGARQIARDQVLLGLLVKKNFGRIKLNYDLVELQTPAKAKDLAARISRDPGRSAELMGAEPGAARPAQLGQTAGGGAGAASAADGGSTQSAIEAVLYYAPANTVLVQSANSAEQGGGYQVIYVRSVELAPTADETDLSQVQPQQLLYLGRLLMRPLADELGVNVSPRYGVWDPMAMQVVPQNEAAAAGELLHAKSGKA